MTRDRLNALEDEHLEELSDLVPGETMSHDLAAAIRDAEMAERFD